MSPRNKQIVCPILLCLALAALIFAFERFPQKQAVLAQTRSLNYLAVSKVRNKFHLPLPAALDSALAVPLPPPPRSPVADPPAGFYSAPIRVHLRATRPGGIIRYTLDGSTPSRQSFRYQSPLAIDSTTVLRFREFPPDSSPGPVFTHTYLVANVPGLPVLSLVSDPANLWNKYSGIYANALMRGQKWERLAHVEYFDERHRRQLDFPAALRIHGNWTRKRSKKSFRFRYHLAQVAGKKAGHFLTAPGYTPWRTVVLRAAAGSITGTLRDELFNTLYLQTGGIAAQSFPVALLLNGEFWGIYYLREKIDPDFLQRRFGHRAYDLLYKQRDVVAGSSTAWKDFRDFFRKSDLSDSLTFQQFAAQMDITDFIDFWAYNIYAANLDWPHVNLYVFRPRTPGGKWRWISWDADATFWRQQGMKHNTFAWAARKEVRHDLKWGKSRGYRDQWRNIKYSTIFRKALQNRDFQAAFVTRFCDLLNGPLHPQTVDATLAAILSDLQGTLLWEFTRWSVDSAYVAGKVQGMREFIARRPDIILAHIRQELDLGELRTLEVRVSPEGAGSVKVNRILPPEYPWRGRYFPDFPLAITAVPAPGYRFSHWSGISAPTPEIQIQLQENHRLTAHFLPQQITVHKPPAGE